MADKNLDTSTVTGFGEEWSRFDQRELSGSEKTALFDRYFSIFPMEQLTLESEGFDFGSGSGRWAERLAPRVGRLHLLDASPKALEVAKRNLAAYANCDFAVAEPESIPLAENSQDFGYSLGVLHHVPDTRAALAACVRKLKQGAPFLLYLYYRFDNRPFWFRAIWSVSDILRRVVASLPFFIRARVCDALALSVYWPLARSAALLEYLGCLPRHFPLASYRHLSFYSMRTDALDRFGTHLEQRFTRQEMESMMIDAGLGGIRFSETEPFWVACGFKRSAGIS